MGLKLAVASAAMVTATAATTPPPSPGSFATVPFTVEESGASPRVIVVARFNGHAMPMMVHSNASFFAQLRHAQAKAFGVRLLPGTHRSYGIDRKGHVSDLGLDRGVVRSVAVGGSVVKDAPVSVFEVPQDRLGMFGIGWIRLNRLVVDFGRKQVLISPPPARVDALKADLRRRGYVAVPMTYDGQAERYVVDATINGVTRSMSVTTSSALTVDAGFATAATLPRGADDAAGSGPTGMQVPRYAFARPIRIAIGGWMSPPIADGHIIDEYAYSARQRPADPATASGGDLGGAFLQKTEAVIDFGSRTLFVKGGTIVRRQS